VSSSCGKKWLLLALFSVAGCSVPKDVAHLQPSDTPSLHVSVQNALSSQDFQEGSWPKEQWWDMFDDPNLSFCIQKALSDNPSLKKAEDHAKWAGQITKGKKGLLFPELDALAQTSWNYLAKDSFIRSIAPTTPPTYNEVTIGFSFNWELDFWGKNRKLFYAALGKERAERAEAAASRLMVSISVAQTYFDLQAQLAKLVVLGKILEERKALYELHALRKVSGLDNQIEENLSQESLYSIEKKILQTEERIQTDRHLLNILQGDGPNDSLMISSNKDYLDAFPIPKEISLDLVARRPDLMAQIWRVEAAAQEIGVAKADFYPNVNLGAFGGFDSLNFDNLFTWPNKTAGLLPAIHLPLFTGGKLQANLGAKAYAFAEAVHAYNNDVLHAAKEVADQITILHKACQQCRVQDHLVKSKEQNYLLSEQRFMQGISTYLSVLKYSQEVLEQELVAIDLQYLRKTASLKLIKALGGGYMTPQEIPTPRAAG